MGWWSATIMGGDSPLDYLGNLAEVCYVNFDVETDEETFHCFRFTRESLEKHTKEIYKSLRECKSPIYGQVVGAAFLWTGAEMEEALKSRVIGDAQKDEWAAEGDEERKKHIDKFIEEVENHTPGKRVDIDDEGLLENIAKALGGGC
jgi:hypothetical protein